MPPTRAYLDSQPRHEFDSLHAVAFVPRFALHSVSFMVSMSATVSLVSAEDKIRIRTDLLLAFERQDREDAILGLCGQAAQFAVDCIQESLGSAQTLNQSSFDKYPQDRRRRLLLKLALKSNRLPSTLFLQRILCPDKERYRAGGFADIYRGMLGQRVVALKVLRIYEMMEPSKRLEVKNALYHEALLWHSLEHDHVLPFLGIDDVIFKNSLSMVLPWMDAGSIRDVMDKRKTDGEPMDVLYQSVLTWLLEIALGLEYLHGERIVHGDLRGANILIDATGAARLTDFGLAVFADGTSHHYASTRGGAIRWLAPELIDGDIFGISSSRPTFASDIYAFACVCVELFIFQAPFTGALSDHQVLVRVPMGVRPPRPSFDRMIHMNMPNTLWALVSNCWSHFPDSRLSISQVVQQIVPQIEEQRSRVSIEDLNIETEDAKTRSGFRKMSDCNGDKTDRNKGQSIDQLQIQSIGQRSAEKKWDCGTFDDGQRHVLAGSAFEKPDLELACEFKGNCSSYNGIGIKPRLPNGPLLQADEHHDEHGSILPCSTSTHPVDPPTIIDRHDARSPMQTAISPLPRQSRPFRVLSNLSALLTSSVALRIVSPILPSRLRSHGVPAPSQIVSKNTSSSLRRQSTSGQDDLASGVKVKMQCKTPAPLLRFRIARQWARDADANRTSALQSYQAAIEHLLISLEQGLGSCRQILASDLRCDGLAGDAAACAISLRQFDKAVVLLEQGRAIFWSKALQLRTPFDCLKSVAPELAQKLESVACAIEQRSLQVHDRPNIPLDTSRRFAVEQDAAHGHRLNEDWLSMLEDIRKLDGFHDFLRPKSAKTLQQAASNGPITMLVATEANCFALLLTQFGVEHIPIPTLTLLDVAALVHLIRIATPSDAGQLPLSESALMNVKALLQQMLPLANNAGHLLFREDQAGGAVTELDIESDQIFRAVLRKLWISVVEPIVRSLRLERKKTPSYRLWWCPTGPFASLPMHAAGIYDDHDSFECVSDYAISSYTPTISALLAQPPVSAERTTMLAVIQPKTNGQNPLPYTEEELRKIELHIPHQSLVKLGIPGAPASVEGVLSDLTSASVVHLACHGMQHPKNPLESALLLEDGLLTVSEIMKQPLPNAALAFLSTCQTAMGSEDIPDEVSHLGATLLFAGFRGTIATMWEMADEDGPPIADHFYAYLLQGRSSRSTNAGLEDLDITRAAAALHHSVAQLRASGISFARWVPFIHLGI